MEIALLIVGVLLLVQVTRLGGTISRNQAVLGQAITKNLNLILAEIKKATGGRVR